MLFEWDADQPDHVVVDGVPVPLPQLDRFVRGTYDGWETDWSNVVRLRREAS